MEGGLPCLTHCRNHGSLASSRAEVDIQPFREQLRAFFLSPATCTHSRVTENGASDNPSHSTVLFRSVAMDLLVAGGHPAYQTTEGNNGYAPSRSQFPWYIVGVCAGLSSLLALSLTNSASPVYLSAVSQAPQAIRVSHPATVAFNTAPRVQPASFNVHSNVVVKSHTAGTGGFFDIAASTADEVSNLSVRIITNNCKHKPHICPPTCIPPCTLSATRGPEVPSRM